MQVSFPTISGHNVRTFAIQLADLPNATIEARAVATVDAAMRNRNMVGITEIKDPFSKHPHSVCKFPCPLRILVTDQRIGTDEP